MFAVFKRYINSFDTIMVRKNIQFKKDEDKLHETHESFIKKK